MKRTASLPALALCTLLTLPAQAAAPERATESRNVAAFTALDLAGPFDVRVDADSPRALRLSGPAQELANIETFVERDTLVVRPKQRNGWTFSFGKRSEPVVVTIGAPLLKSVKSGGSGDVTVERVRGDALQLTVSGSGDLRANGNVRELALRAGGSGDVDLRALHAATLRVQMNGSGDVDAAGVTQELAAELNGSGDLEVHDVHADKITATLHGSGSMTLQGRGREIGAKVTGSGDLTAHDLQAQSVRIEQSGSGDVALSGTANTLEVSIGGSGDLEGEELTVGRATVRGSGSGGIHLQRVTESLDAQLNGSGGLATAAAAKMVRITLAGTSNARLEGRTGLLTAQLSGSGGIDGRDFEADRAQISVRGSGNAVVNVRGKIEAQGRQHDDTGHPRLVTVDRSGLRDAR